MTTLLQLEEYGPHKNISKCWRTKSVFYPQIQEIQVIETHEKKNIPHHLHPVQPAFSGVLLVAQ
jgi:hypothetical protein